MEKNKKIALIVAISLAVLLVASIVLNIISITFYVSLTKNANKEIKNVILLIGDGMGFNHLEQTKKATILKVYIWKACPLRSVPPIPLME